MAAIIPFLERQNDPAEHGAVAEELTTTADESPATVEDAARALSGGRFGMHGLGDIDPEGLTAEAISQMHAELVNTAWIRESVVSSLVGKSYQVVRQGREIFLLLDTTIDPDGLVVPWNPPASPTARKFSVLSWTSKMAAPSFSLPAGPLEAGGACPGATAGQSIVPVEALLAASRRVQAVTGEPVRLQHAICGFCYAEGGQYSTGQVQFAQAMRYAWARDAARDVKGGKLGPVARLWVDTMVEAIDAADFALDGKVKSKKDASGEKVKTQVLLPERLPGRFFRIHDSGDFFSAAYLRLWKEIANSLPDITFWAPTRIWATSWGIDAVNEINGPAERSNLVIRPSAYHINEGPVPRRELGEGWASGSSAIHKNVKEELLPRMAEWDCQTYAVDDESHTCRHATAPDGEVGCRACWVRPELRINYTLH